VAIFRSFVIRTEPFSFLDIGEIIGHYASTFTRTDARIASIHIAEEKFVVYYFVLVIICLELRELGAEATGAWRFASTGAVPYLQLIAAIIALITSHHRGHALPLALASFRIFRIGRGLGSRTSLRCSFTLAFWRRRFALSLLLARCTTSAIEITR
jgi:hypothetical protein